MTFNGSKPVAVDGATGPGWKHDPFLGPQK